VLELHTSLTRRPLAARIPALGRNDAYDGVHFVCCSSDAKSDRLLLNSSPHIAFTLIYPYISLTIYHIPSTFISLISFIPRITPYSLYADSNLDTVTSPLLGSESAEMNEEVTLVGDNIRRLNLDSFCF
jgi:hypothetical protein